MKNLFFSLAFMLIGSFTFASNSNQTVLSENLNGHNFYVIESTDLSEDLAGTCYVTLSFFDGKGNKLGGTVIQINNVDSAAQCSQLAQQIVNELNSKI